MLWRLSGKAEVVVGERGEVGGVADEDAVVARQMVFESGRSVRLYGSEHEVGVCVTDVDARNGVERVSQTLSLIEICRYVVDDAVVVGEQPLPCLQRECVDGPWPLSGFEPPDERFRSDDESEPQAGNGIALGERAYLNDIVMPDSFLWRHQWLERIVFV